MEALGRFFTVILSVTGVVFLLFFYKTSSFLWQRNESVRSISHAFAEKILEEKEVSQKDLEMFQKQLKIFGEYQVSFTVYERRSYEGENGSVFLYREVKEPEGEQKLSLGSYVRLVVTEEERSKAEVFLYGEGCSVYAGGRIA